MFNKDAIVMLVNDNTVPITHKRTVMKFYYEYLLKNNKDDANELLNILKSKQEILQYVLREKWYLQHKYYNKMKTKKQEEQKKQMMNMIDNN